MSKLTNGRIPAGEACPWAQTCRIALAGQCYHKGVKHEVAFSCALARGFDLVERNDAARAARIIPNV